MKVTGSQLIARALKAEGVENIFTLAGDHVLPLMDHMADEGFRFVDTRHEQAAVDMANAWGRITGTPGVSMFTSPGHANAIPGLTLAKHMESPVINISGSAEQGRLGQGAGQEMDQVGMAAPVTKGSWFVPDPRRIPYYLARAFRTALTGRRGPVHLTIPVDVQEAEVDEDEVDFRRTGEYRPAGMVAADRGQVARAIEILNSAARPIAVASEGAFSASSEQIHRLIETTRIPLVTEETARGVVPDDHPLCFGYADARVSAAATMLSSADAVLLLGKKLDFTIDFGEPPAISADARIIQVEPSAELVGLSRPVDVAVVGDVGAAVGQLADEADSYTWNERPILKEMEAAADSQRERLEALGVESSPLHAMSVHRALAPHLDADTCLVFEGSDFAFFGAAYHPSLKPGRWFTNITLGMIGYGLPFGLGAQVALPGSRVVVMTGDGAFGFSGMELDTAVRHNLPVVVIVGNDSVWGIDYHQQVQLWGKAVATELLPTRYDKMAEALGAHGEFVETADQLPGALDRAFASGRPALVNVTTRPDPSPLTDFILKRKGASTGPR